MNKKQTKNTFPAIHSLLPPPPDQCRETGNQDCCESITLCHLPLLHSHSLTLLQHQIPPMGCSTQLHCFYFWKVIHFNRNLKEQANFNSNLFFYKNSTLAFFFFFLVKKLNTVAEYLGKSFLHIFLHPIRKSELYHLYCQKVLLVAAEIIQFLIIKLKLSRDFTALIVHHRNAHNCTVIITLNESLFLFYLTAEGNLCNTLLILIFIFKINIQEKQADDIHHKQKLFQNF